MNKHKAAPVIQYGSRAKLGVLLPSGNVAAEPQFTAMLPQGVSMHTSRLTLTGSSDAELLAMTERLDDGAKLLADACVDLILFHCTAVTMWDAEMDSAIPEKISSAAGIQATSTARAVLWALKALNAQRIVLVSPYIDAINAREVAFLASKDVSVLSAIGLGITEAREMVKVEPAEWYRLVRSRSNRDADAYFISCTAVRSLEVIDMLEQDLGKPVVTSNQAALWHSLRVLGLNDRLEGFGHLLNNL